MTNPTTTVTLPRERSRKRFDSQLDHARTAAKASRATVTITRESKSGRIEPVLEVTEHGDVREVAAPRMTLSIGARGVGNERMTKLAAEATRLIDEQRRRQQYQRRRPLPTRQRVSQ